MLYDFDLNKAIDVFDFTTFQFYCRPKSFEYRYPNLPKFQFVKSQKLSDYRFQNLQKIAKLKCH